MHFACVAFAFNVSVLQEGEVFRHIQTSYLRVHSFSASALQLLTRIAALLTTSTRIEDGMPGSTWDTSLSNDYTDSETLENKFLMRDLFFILRTTMNRKSDILVKTTKLSVCPVPAEVYAITVVYVTI